jgi:hypothetical protein
MSELRDWSEPAQNRCQTATRLIYPVLVRKAGGKFRAV